MKTLLIAILLIFAISSCSGVDKRKFWEEHEHLRAECARMIVMDDSLNHEQEKAVDVYSKLVNVSQDKYFLSMMDIHQEIEKGHVAIREKHAHIAKAHIQLENRHLILGMDDKTILSDHARMQKYHKEMKEDHLRIHKEHAQMFLDYVEWEQRKEIEE
ncbi:hypothetical protein F9K33_09370 [bacterium]|nr:MAG: hypothetical protein F9K33_09370 [bacterium]